MKKFFRYMFLISVFCFIFTNVSFAATKVTENSGIKIFISGKQIKFSSTPVTVNGEVLLNVSELVVKLGVPNDSKHLIIDKSKKNLTINNNEDQIKMVTNSTKATVNMISKTLNSAPIVYKTMLYIPVKSTAELLGFKFAWDASAKSAYIQSTDNYNKVKSILEKAFKTTIAKDKYSLVFTSDWYDPADTYDKYISLVKVDRSKKIRVSKYEIEGQEEAPFYSQNYIVNNTQYEYQKPEVAKDGTILENEQMEKTVLTEKDRVGWFLQDDVSQFVISDILYCGLLIEENQKENKIIFKGDVYIPTRAVDVKPEVSKAHTEITVNQSTNLIKKIVRQYNQSESLKSGKTLLNATDTYDYRDFNGDFSGEYNGKAAKELKTALDSTKIKPDNISDNEDKIMSQLASKTMNVFVDGAYENPYEIKTTEGMMFINFKNKKDFDLYNTLSMDAKKIFINKIIQTNYLDYIRTEIVYGMVTYDSYIYGVTAAAFGTVSEKMILTEFDEGSYFTLVMQDKENNTYWDYMD